jgi:hypothetical protein
MVLSQNRGQMADRLMDSIFFTLRLNLSCFLYKCHHGYVFDILLEKSEQRLYLIKRIFNLSSGGSSNLPRHSRVLF